MNRRQFLSSAVSVGVSAALPAKALPDRKTTLTIDELVAWQIYICQQITKTQEYWRTEYDLIVYGRSVFDPAKALAEI